MADDEAFGAAARSERTDRLWADVRIDPVEIALPKPGGAGLTLRAYRPAGDVAPPQTSGEPAPLDDFDAAAAAVARRRRADDAGEEDTADRAEEFDEDFQDDLGDELDAADQAEAEDEPEDEESEAVGAEEVPVFLARKGRLFLFDGADKLIEFIRSGAEHDLSQLDTWADLVRRVSAEDVVALDEDTYELDLVVPNLRGGPDSWDPTLLIKAGEIVRDVGYALRLEPVIVAMAAGSPLDDLDNALRAVDAGGVRGFLAQRRLRKIAVQQSALAWRTLIGKISAAADWRE